MVPGRRARAAAGAPSAGRPAHRVALAGGASRRERGARDTPPRSRGDAVRGTPGALLAAEPARSGTRPLVSFEFFPPKTPEMEAKLWQTVKRLEPLGPRFVSVTYGAGGSTRERTHATVLRIRQETALEPAAHLTCIGAPCAEIDEVARRYWQAGIRHLVALRGDAAAGEGPYRPHPGGYDYAAALVEGLRRVAD